MLYLHAPFACRDWLNVSREHLFSEFHVPRGPDKSFEDLAEFLETHSILAGYGRVLRSNAIQYPAQFRAQVID